MYGVVKVYVNNYYFQNIRLSVYYAKNCTINVENRDINANLCSMPS